MSVYPYFYDGVLHIFLVMEYSIFLRWVLHIYQMSNVKLQQLNIATASNIAYAQNVYLVSDT
jgi:hypothetical protein